MHDKHFIERSLMGALAFLKECLFADEYAAQKGFLQARDPRIKVAVVVMLLLAVLFARHWLIIVCLYALCLVLAVSSSINLVFFLKRTWLFIPLFSLCIAIPAIFHVVSPGERLFSVQFFSNTLEITRQGVMGAAIFFLRVLTSVSLCVLLVLTTKHFYLLKALQSFRVPQIFIMTLGMCYRYIFLFIEIMQSTYLAIKSRVGYVLSARRGERLVAWNIAMLWQRSFYLQTQVYQAMLSRGYSGEVRVADEAHITFSDKVFAVAVFLLLAGVIWQNYFLS